MPQGAFAFTYVKISMNQSPFTLNTDIIISHIMFRVVWNFRDLGF